MNIAEIYAKISKAVVRIETEESHGSGIIIDKRGLVLTNYHVVEFENFAILFFYNGKIDIGRVIISNRKRDVAFIYFKLKGLPEAKLNYSKKIKIGEEIIAVGHPKNLPYSVTKGIVSYPVRIIEEDPHLPYIQYDAVIHFGSSGGPIINQNGEVIGITCKGWDKDLNLAIPISDIKLYLSDIKNRFNWYQTSKYCCICGNANSHVVKFCQKCGTRLPSHGELVQEIKNAKSMINEKVMCKSCLNINTKENMICSFCGSSLHSIRISMKEDKYLSRKVAVCPVCKKRNNITERYCKHCGIVLPKSR